MSFTKKFMNVAAPAILLAATTLGSNALAQEQQTPPLTPQQIAATCKNLNYAINNNPGFTVIFTGHPQLIYKPDNLRKAAENMCPSIKALWNQQPAHHWKRKDTGASLRTKKDLALPLASAVQQFHGLIHGGDPVIGAIVHSSVEAHQDFHFVMALVDQMVASYPDIFPPQPGGPQP